MKIPALLTFLVAAVLSALPLSHARADDVSFDVFYNNLGDQGDWYNTPEYGYVWQPSIAYQNDKWRPYSDGYWAQTDDGWTWVSYENFGWATYHYGRWTNLEGTGWVWVPGYEWGPGWVSWRTNDDYVGWAPLPPKRERTSGTSSNTSNGGASLTVDYNTVEPEEGYNSEVDEQYDIGPANYCFVETRHFGAPVLREVLLPPQRNIVIIENTINVTRIDYRRTGPGVVVYNGGPDFAFISGRCEQPIQRLRIDRRDDIGFLRDGSRGRNPNVVRDGVFQIAAPRIQNRPVNFNQIKPPTIKRDLPQPRVDHGWRNTGADQQTVDRVRQQFQTQAREHPTRPPGNPAANNLTSPAAPPQRDARTNAPVGMPPADPRQRDARSNAPAGTPPADPHQRERDARATPPAPPAGTPATTNTPLRGNSDADKRARRDAAQREKEARDTQNNGGEPTPAATPGGRPSAPPHNPPGQPNATPRDQRHVPNNPDVTHEPTAAPTPAREANPTREPRNHGPTTPLANTPAPTPRADVPREEARHTPRQPERTAPANPSARNPEADTERHPARNPEADTERHPARTQDQPRPQTPPSAPRPEVREQPRQPAQTAPPAARPETRESRPRPQPSAASDDDKKKKRDGQQ